MEADPAAALADPAAASRLLAAFVALLLALAADPAASSRLLDAWVAAVWACPRAVSACVLAVLAALAEAPAAVSLAAALLAEVAAALADSSMSFGFGVHAVAVAPSSSLMSATSNVWPLGRLARKKRSWTFSEVMSAWADVRPSHLYSVH